MNPFAVIGINAGISFAVAFAGALAGGYSWRDAAMIGLAALVGNQTGLHQRQPKQSNS